MDIFTYETTIKGLIYTAKEISCVMGKDGLQEIQNIKKLIIFMETFWNCNEDLSTIEWENFINIIIEEI